MKDTAAHILVVDDEQSVLDNFAGIFDRESCIVRGVRTWPDAAVWLKTEQFNVIIIDVNLPGTGYRTMIEAIKESDKYAFILTTAGFADIDLAMESIQNGAHDYLTKPFDSADVTVLMRKIIEKQRLQSDNIQLFDTIKVLALALDARDHYTHGHSQQVTDYSVEIAREMGLSAEEIERIRDAGILHDIGKIGIPDSVLLKPGRLTAEEYMCIKKHPEIGRNILEPVACLADKIPLIYHHHERVDGKGYPLGLEGDAIPLGARILAVADAYQAMTSDRPYRLALPAQVAIAELEQNKGKQFDAKIVEVFIRVLKRMGIAPRAGE